MLTFFLPRSQKLANLYRYRPPGRPSQLLRRHGPKMQGAIVCDQGREMPAEKVEEGDMGRPHLMQGAIVCDQGREMPAEKVEEGDMGRPHLRRQCRLEVQRRGGALLSREGQGWPVTARRRRAA